MSQCLQSKKVTDLKNCMLAEDSLNLFVGFWQMLTANILFFRLHFKTLTVIATYGTVLFCTPLTCLCVCVCARVVR